MRPSSRLQSSKPSANASARRTPNLHLPGLPRFHPANFTTGSSSLSSSSASASGNSSSANSPLSSTSSPQAPVLITSPQRPQYHSRQYSDAQRQLYAYQRELMSMSQYTGLTPRPSQPTSPSGNARRGSPLSPRSPRLHPLGSPGPVTPLELEEHSQQRDGYLFAGAGLDADQLSEEAKDQILETFIQKEALEARARGGLSPNMKSHAQQARAYSYFAGPTGVRRGDHTSHRSALSR